MSVYFVNQIVLIKGTYWKKAIYISKDKTKSLHTCKYTTNGFDCIVSVEDNCILPYHDFEKYENTGISKQAIFNNKLNIEIGQEVLFKSCPDHVSSNGIWCKGYVRNIDRDLCTISFKFIPHTCAVMGRPIMVSTCYISVPLKSVFPCVSRMEEMFLDSTVTETTVMDYWYSKCHDAYTKNCP